ncbi:MAG: hypothetical protein K9K75_06395 [Deltaproteobacteria bacterium]|nr:hypothetical protein [Deltaproteobacteria bacterium]
MTKQKDKKLRLPVTKINIIAAIVVAVATLGLLIIGILEYNKPQQDPKIIEKNSDSSPAQSIVNTTIQNSTVMQIQNIKGGGKR